MSDFIYEVSKINSNIIVSPILDSNKNLTKLKLYSRIGINFLKISNSYHSFLNIKKLIKKIIVRSEFEKKYINKIFGFDILNTVTLPLSYNLPENQSSVKESFCLHVSILTDDRKNVKRLIQAAIKYNFNLILVGHLRNDNKAKLFFSWIGDNKNIQYLGILSKTKLLDLYSRASVFALPSISEGVGIVALEAAAMGCNIVITNIGGPKEYYNNLAKFINPYNIDDIGIAINEFLNGDTFQPKLSDHIKDNFSLDKITNELIRVYETIL